MQQYHAVVSAEGDLISHAADRFVVNKKLAHRHVLKRAVIKPQRYIQPQPRARKSMKVGLVIFDRHRQLF